MENNRPRSREKHVAGPGKTVHKRGDGLGTGPVGSSGGHSEATPSSGGGTRGSGSGSRGGGMKLIVLLLILHHIVRWYGTRAGGALYVLYVAQYFFLMLPAGMLCWLFPLLGRFEYTVGGLFRTALQLTVAHLPSTVVVVLLTAQTAVFCIEEWWPVVFMPAVATLLISLFFERIFQKHSPEPEDPEPPSAI